MRDALSPRRSVLDLFSAAAGGWSLGMHRAGFETVAACEVIDWRRALYAENFPNVRLYDDVRTLSATRILADLGYLPEYVVGSPPCQDISSANPRGRGVDGERSGLYFEAVRLVGEIRPRAFAFENSPNLRTRGADRIIPALEGLGYAVESFVVGAGDLGAPHERKRAWIVGYALAHPHGYGEHALAEHGQVGIMPPVDRTGRRQAPDPDKALCANGRLEPGTRAQEIAGSGCGDERRHEGGGESQGGLRAGPGDALREPWAQWNGGPASHLLLDHGISSWVAGARVAVGDGVGRSAARLIIEAFGDAVIPQIPEAIARAILSVEAALAEESAHV